MGLVFELLLMKVGIYCLKIWDSFFPRKNLDILTLYSQVRQL